MRRRRLLLGAGLLALLGLAGLFLLSPLSPPTPGVTRANYERIRVGMTTAEVEALLGPSWHTELVGANGEVRRWWGADTGIDVFFSTGGQVESAGLFDLEPETDRPFLNRLRRLLPW